MTKTTMQELRAECARLGITPGRSIEETRRRIHGMTVAVPNHQAGLPDETIMDDQPAPPRPLTDEEREHMDDPAKGAEAVPEGLHVDNLTGVMVIVESAPRAAAISPVFAASYGKTIMDDLTDDMKAPPPPRPSMLARELCSGTALTTTLVRPVNWPPIIGVAKGREDHVMGARPWPNSKRMRAVAVHTARAFHKGA